MESLAKLCYGGLIFFLHLHSPAAQSVGSVPRGFRFSPPAGAGDFSAFLVSSNRDFAAGFSRDPATGYFALAVAGMNANSQPLDTIWMANRDDPFRATPELLFSGSLLVTIHQNVQWNSSSSTTSPSSSSSGDFLELLDSGNLRLVSRSSSSSPPSDDQAGVVWQSFDHPTDTLLQGQNFTQAMRLVSSISNQDPRSGSYSLQLQGDRILLLAGSEPYWTEAALKEHDNGTGSTIYMRIQPEGYIGLYQSEQTRVHFVPFSSLNRASTNFTRRARLDPDGNLRVYYWQGGRMVEDYAALRDPCEFPDSCGSYGICSSELQNKSCKCPVGVTADGNSTIAFLPVDSRDAAKGCRSDAADANSCMETRSKNSSEDDFLMIQGVDYFAIRFVVAAFGVSTVTLEECRALCLGNCSCKAFFFRNDSSVCFHTGSIRSMLPSSNPHNLGFIRIAKRGRSHHTSRALQISILVLAVLLAIAALIFACYYRRSRRRDENKGEVNHHSDEEAFLETISGLPKRFPFSEIESAKNTRRISVVQLQGCSPREFQAELADIARLGSHSNLVALLGYCIHGKKRYIIYDGSTSGSRSLDEILKNPGLEHPTLEWSAKKEILLGIARGLAFLHANGGVHGDLVPGNVLLDLDHGGSSSPRLARYGLASLMRRPPPNPSDDVRAFGAIVAALLDGGDGAPAEDQRLREIWKCCALQEAVLRPSMAMVAETLSSILPPKASFGIQSLN
ncbi:hypothetical protein SELMODRAFT_440099 [Selaginella moellendorffii]|uniref:Receptor-like serine/threonine-protein kinase n=1 Tax=Selaginella moellendorffii TaxID=88036 RepID=D8RA35_SELML|nr:PAN domain-containing protein At5g03700 [Selaginella moellendorffii]EFJ31261.1 hypothetical protein SELMODRAFT_440099 [Selaginella moellendorffii]|eukprot:XP_002967914.1 PAN domain-containing protein At5g03700 [Selaginella moellendorffii]